MVWSPYLPMAFMPWSEMMRVRSSLLLIFAARFSSSV